MKLVHPVAAALVTVSIATPAFAQNNTAQAPAPIGIISWILIGLVSGYLASRVINKEGEGFIRDVILGIVGAFIGGIIVHFFGGTGVTGFNVWSILVAFFGAVVLLIAYHALRGSPSRA
ncbi:MAG: GlsB/YeaQ/YmgE family stress response membrane protein [Candidatus Binataceae bacterium]